ncbi:threonine/serine dehydratase [Elioraea sp.]|uniref:threonine ammonia-lyase n=1 Tax=Elioraea sp. TaxID=2185103 RepID=UPI0021DD62F0|nr:pyridoxal-phosphate dependent enzyme [Elioraea sp.]GIX09795.1 MAG: serine/threonine dehydratase [Elioraea sp.]
MITLADVQAAARRIAPFVRRTPLFRVALPPLPELALKLDTLQLSGSFKARGAFARLTLLDADERRAGLVTASGGNHGIAVACAAREAGVPATVFVPRSVHPAKAERIRRYGARLEVAGTVWDEANLAALAHAAAAGATYVHPFADPAVAAGQGTTALEILADAPEVDTILVAIGGGGLASGVAVAATALKPGIRIVGVEPTGAPTLHASLAAGAVVTLPAITTRVPTLAAGRTDERVFALLRDRLDRVVLIEDSDMEAAARLLWDEAGIAADLSGAAAVAAVLAGAYRPAPGERVAAIVCGAGADGISAAAAAGP